MAGMKNPIFMYINERVQHLCSSEETHIYLTNISVIKRQLTEATVDVSCPNWIYFKEIIEFSPYIRMILKNSKLKKNGYISEELVYLWSVHQSQF